MSHNASDGVSRVIKKYPNRRLYDTATSSYITLAEVKRLVLEQVVFQVADAKTGEDLTRSILLQIILEEEGHQGAPMFTNEALMQIIRFYGHSMQSVMGSYLEGSVRAFVELQHSLQEQARALYSDAPQMKPETWAQMFHNPQASMPAPMSHYLEQSAKVFLDTQEKMRRQTMSFFGVPFADGQPDSAAASDGSGDKNGEGGSGR